MAPGAGLSLRQKQFLAVVLRQGYILQNFYLSGGTALSSWYLHHRASLDLDFFSDRRFQSDRLIRLVKENQDRLEARAITLDEDFGFLTFFLRYSDNSRLKVDFNHYSSFRLEKGIVWRGLEIDSLYDIAVNKIQAIRAHPRERDYVDLYFIIKGTDWPIDRLLKDADRKFAVLVDELQTAKQFLKAAELQDFTKMLVPFNPKAMEEFYRDLALSLRTKIFK